MKSTLGMMVRARRLGFAPIQSGFMRLSGGDDGKPFLCELHPLHLIPNSAKSDVPHWCWWTSLKNGEGIDVRQIEGVRNLRRVKLPFSFYFDEDGRTV